MEKYNYFNKKSFDAYFLVLMVEKSNGQFASNHSFSHNF
jgi:hypothetical protein